MGVRVARGVLQTVLVTLLLAGPALPALPVAAQTAPGGPPGSPGNLPPGTWVAHLADFSRDNRLYRTVDVYRFPALKLTQAQATIVVGLDGTVQSGSISYRFEGPSYVSSTLSCNEVKTLQSTWDATTIKVLPVPPEWGETRFWAAPWTQTDDMTPPAQAPNPTFAAQACNYHWTQPQGTLFLMRVTVNDAGQLVICGDDPSPENPMPTRATCLAGNVQATLSGGAPLVAPAAPPALVRDCTATDAAFDEVFLRVKATRLALERERNLHSLLDQAHEDLRKSIYAGAVVDLAALAPGWPLSSGVVDKFFDEEKHKLVNTLLNAGLKSVETRVAKDQSLAGVGDQLTKLDFGTGLPIEGAASDVGWEGVKSGLAGAMGDSVADTSFFAFDLLKFGLSAYEGMNQLDASLDMLRRVNEHISSLQALDGELSAVTADAQSAREYCQKQIADGRPFDTNDPALTRVRDYLGE